MLLKPNRVFYFIILVSLIIPFSAMASIGKYNPNIDIDSGLFILFTKDENRTEPIPGGYLGGHLIMESPVLKNNFDIKRIYTIYNFGILTLKGPGTTYVLLINGLIELGYNFNLFKNFYILPFAGWGLSIIPIDYYFIHRNAFLTLNIGLLFRYKIWKDCYLKLKIEGGMLYGSEFENGYTNYIRVIFPIPFIP